MIIEIHDVWHAASVAHETYVRAAMTQAWDRLFALGPPVPLLGQVRAFVDKHEAEIVGAATRNYLASVADYDHQFPPGTRPREEAKAILKRVFNYDAFRDAKVGWNAYALCASSPYTVCPYCHIAATNTAPPSNSHKGYRPQLDHFIGRAEYPFLALSLGNLVPSCSTCNGANMKHTTDVLAKPHLYPLADPSVLTFKLRPKGGQSWSPLHRALRVPPHAYEIAIDAPAGHAAAENSLQTFQLHSRYQPYLHDAFRIAKADKDGAWRRMIRSVLGVALSAQDHLGFSIADNCADYKNIPQGKMRMDVYKDSRGW